MSIEEMKERFIDGSLEKGIFTSGNDTVVKVFDSGFSISTFQDNGWTRINIYEYDGDTWTYEETYEK